jgi:16S rRNA (guanine966-N2)-methyltransferase
MTRIIGGTAGGRRLKAPAGERTRPTSDRVREALFSSLDSDLGSLAGLRFLDLYAGSGAVGLEARSRGAGVVTLVEQDRRTASLIRDNLRTLGFNQVEVVAGSVARVLAGPPRAPYDVVFLDPPYDLATADVVADLAASSDTAGSPRARSWWSSAPRAAVGRSGRRAWSPLGRRSTARPRFGTVTHQSRTSVLISPTAPRRHRETRSTSA